MPMHPHGPWGCTCRTSNGRCWTTRELMVLEALWGRITDEEVAKRLGRGLSAVQSKAAHIGARKMDQALTATAVAHLLGYGETLVVVKMIERGQLCGRRAAFSRGRQRVWSISEDAVRDLLINRPWLANYYEMPDSAFKDIAAPWLTTAQVSKRTGYNLALLQRMCRAGRFPEAQRRERLYMLPAAVLHHIEERLANPGSVKRNHRGIRRAA